MKPILSIIIPAYNEQSNIDNTAHIVLGIMDKAQINCELLFISDGSKDRTYNNIIKAAALDARIHGIEFSRNFGKEAAIMAGLDAMEGECCVIMDCDLQHPPETIVEMYRLWEQGYEIVEGMKKSRGTESILHKKCAATFYNILSALTGFHMENTSDFKLLDKKVAKLIVSMPERQTFFRALTFWTGFKSVQIYYEVAARYSGETKWSVFSLIRYAITNIVSFSSKPLNIVTYIGVLSLMFSIALGIYTFVFWVLGEAVEGFTTVILLMLALGGCILLGLGIIGQYIAAIFEEVKHRPRYIINCTTWKENVQVKTDEYK